MNNQLDREDIKMLALSAVDWVLAAQCPSNVFYDPQLAMLTPEQLVTFKDLVHVSLLQHATEVNVSDTTGESGEVYLRIDHNITNYSGLKPTLINT